LWRAASVGVDLTVARWSRCRYRDAVRGDDLCLEGEDVAALRVDERFHPVNVVRIPFRVGVEGVLAEGLDSREVLDASAVRVEERLVDYEVMRVAVDEDDRFLEGDRLFTQRGENVVKAVGVAVGLFERPRIAFRRSLVARGVEARICLPDDHHRGRV